jgi:Zn-dependent M28 family amino/carboxypeptidase
MSELTPTAHNFVLGVDWGAGKSTGSVTGAVQPAGGIVLPPTQLTSSTSGCTMADFGPSIAGHIALIQRGGCNFGVKVLNAGLAGATGVIIFNEGNPGPPNRTGLLVGSLVDANGNGFIPTMPVAFTTFAVGQDLYNQARTGPAPTVSLSVPAIVRPNADDYNVIAESKGGNPNHVLVVDAHLDAIFGAGMLDNATGSAAIVDIAQKLKNVNPVNKMRFIWFGGEELGLLGSAAYINSLSSNDLSHIGYDLDADVFGHRTTSSASLTRRRRPSSHAPSRRRSRTGSTRPRPSRGISRWRSSTLPATTTSFSRRTAPTRSVSTSSAFRPAAF